jgi:ElaB/YqjD/DUF883 family membrane-anchored ribosome-binding protein
MYFCGKALKNPVSLSLSNQQKMDSVIAESQEQVKQMLDKLSQLLLSIDSPFSVDFDDIKKKYARELVRERHIAQALRDSINQHFTENSSRLAFIKKLFSGEAPKADLKSNSSFEGELRSKLLKAGGAAFVPEDESSFLPIPELVDIVIDAGGIPCYPVLLDDKNGNYTQFEENPEALLIRLKELKVGAVELIPGRNSFDNLRSFVEFFHNNNFLVSFGTEHNTPEMTPLEVKAGGNTSLDDYLLGINEETACIFAAHQERIKNGSEGYLDTDGHCKVSEKSSFVTEGKSILNNFIKE